MKRLPVKALLIPTAQTKVRWILIIALVAFAMVTTYIISKYHIGGKKKR
jgi:hypothetical protein